MSTPPACRKALLPKLLSSAWLLGLLLCLAGVFLFVRVTAWSERNEFERLDDLATRQLDLYVAALESELLRHADLPSLVATSPDIVRLLASAQAPDAVREQASRTLAGFAARTGTRGIHVIDRADRVLAASDGIKARPVARDTRPDIACAAVTTGQARGFSFNRETAAPEYHFVHGVGVSVAEPGIPDACVVVTISLTPMESTWADFSFRPDSEKIVVLDEKDVAILSSVPRWRFKSMPLFETGKPATRSATNPAPAYPAAVSPLPISGQRPIGRGALLVSLPGADGAAPDAFVAHGRLLASTGWRVVLLSSPAEAWESVRAVQLAAAAALAFCALLALYLHHRRRAMKQLLAARNALQLARDQLELAVAERTRELREANAELRREMHERQEAEAELLQAKKMAMLGQMSAKISHEISQPLTALRALTMNTRSFLKQEKWPRVDENLAGIADIVARMSRITRQLKTFSGKTRQRSTPHRPLLLNEAMRNARALLQERIEREGAEVVLPETPYPVLGDAGQLEQVFVNLFSNALDAMSQVQHRRIEVHVDAGSGRERLCVGVRDSGPGIPTEMRAHLFEPFYTSKPTGEGLGLGLVICASIIREHGGELRAEQNDAAGAGAGAGAGAEFIFDLALAITDPLDSGLRRNDAF